MSRSAALHEWKINTAIKKLIGTINTADTRQIVQAINSKIELATFSENSARSHRLDAGRMLLALRKRVEAEGENWWKWQDGRFGRSRRDIERLLAMASADEPDVAVEQERAKARKSVAKSRATTNVCRNSNVVPLVGRNRASNEVTRIMELIAELDDQSREELWAACKEQWSW